MPAGCVSQFATAAGPGGTRIDSLDGVPAGDGWGWQVRVDGGAASAESSEAVGFGDLVYLRFGAESANAGPAPRVKVAPVEAGSQVGTAPAARVSIRGRLDRRGNRLLVTVGCPRGLGGFGCRGVLSARFRAGGHPWRAGGRVGYRVDSGSASRISLPASPGLRKALGRDRRLRLRVLAATRAEDGAVTLTRVHRSLLG